MSATTDMLPRPISRVGREERRERILAAAAELFQDQGYVTTSVDAIGARAGVTGPAVYRHFPSKQDLLLELLGSAAEQALDGNGPDKAAGLDSMVRRIVGQAIARRALIGLLYAEHDRFGDADRKKLERIRKQVVSGWMSALRTARHDLSAAQAETYVQAAMSVVAGIARRANGAVGEDAQELYVRMILGLLRA